MKTGKRRATRAENRGGYIWQDHTVVCTPSLFGGSQGKVPAAAATQGDGAAQTRDEIMNVPSKSEWTRGESQEKRAGWIKIEQREDEKGAPSRLFSMKDLCFSLPVLEADKLPPV